MTLLDATPPADDCAWADDLAWADGHDDEEISDDELTALALAADPEPALGPEAVPITTHRNLPAASLPLWYMPPVSARAAGGWRVPIVASVVLALLLINVLGLCITYGALVAA